MWARRKRLKLWFILFPALILAMAGAARAESWSGTIEGVVTDPANAHVAGAEVYLRSVVTGTVRQAETDGP